MDLNSAQLREIAQRLDDLDDAFGDYSTLSGSVGIKVSEDGGKDLGYLEATVHADRAATVKVKPA